uniref:A18-like helicase n=1 Tax=Pithovirus LCPAC101 TaxID=2506586 RepID=A0A481Z5E7_9VIRU|nr:MAG: A18-like helicase [Pithovirus LCPAC101]
MSIRILRSSISNELSETILKDITFIPKKNFDVYHKWKRVSDEQLVTKNIVAKKYYEKDGEAYINLPYSYGCSKFGIPKFNHPNVKYTFIGGFDKLYDSQIQPTKEAIGYLKKSGSVILNLFTGAGKTIVASYLASLTHKLTLIMYTGDIIGKQWMSTFKDFTDARVWFIDQKGKNLPPKGGAHVIVCMDTRVHWLSQEYVDKIGTVIIDEVHTFCTPERIKCILSVTPQFVIAASATITRGDGLHSIIHSVCGQNIVRRISTKPFKVYKYLTGIYIDAKKNINGVLDWSDFTLKQAISEERRKEVIGLIRAHPTYKILILTWRCEKHVIPLYHYLTSHGIKCDYMSGKKKTYKDSPVLIGTIKKIGTGFDEKAACDDYNGTRIDMLIKLGSTKSPELLEQISGRAFRAEFPIIIDFVDDHPLSENHFTKIAEPWYISRNGSVQIVESPYYKSKKEKGELKHQARSEESNFMLDQQLKHFDMDSMHKSGNIKYDPTQHIQASKLNSGKYKERSYNAPYKSTYNNNYSKSGSDQYVSKQDTEEMLEMQLSRYIS